VNAEVLASLLVAAATLVSSLAGLVVAIRTGQKASATHAIVNGASEEIKGLREERGYRAGLAEQLVGEASLGQRESSGPGTDRMPAVRADVLGTLPPASSDVDPVPTPGNQPLASRARYLRQGGPKKARRF
jgi:hypothetical protein